MDIGALSMAMSQTSVQNAVSVAVVKMGMDNGEGIAEQMNEIMGELSVDPNLGQSIDFMA